ncbi:MAG: hypothetical protein KDD55_11000 [Bdellovibrionales bacterium]|nr:hypothetical protein [Bdellovibrionales bacterium]
MKRSQYTNPDTFSSSPFLALLPDCGSTNRLSSLTSSLYARYEKVAAIRDASSDLDVESRSRIQSEYSMLRHVLEWLEVNLEDLRSE